MRFSLNSNIYVTPPGSAVAPILLDPLAVPIRDTGTQRRSDFTLYNRFVFNAWTNYGIGWQRMRRDRGRGEHGMRDADAETRFESGVYLPYLNQDATDSTNLLLSRFAAELLSEIYIFGEKTTVTENPYVSQWAGATTTWGAGTATTDNDNSIMQDVAPARTLLGVLYTLNDNFLQFRTWSGSAWGAIVQVSTGGGITITDSGKIISLDDVLWVFYSGGTVGRLRKSTDNGAIWATAGSDVAVTAVTGKAIWYDLNGDPAPVFGTAQGVYAADTSANQVQLLLELPSNADNCRGMFAANGKLYVSTGLGGMYELSMPAAGVISARIMTFPGPDSLPTARKGFVTGRVAVADRWAFIPYGGDTASRNASILAYDLFSYQELRRDVTHSFYSHPTANQKILWCFLSSLNDSTTRLHFGVSTAATTTDERFIAAPLDDPAAGGTINYETTGYVEIAEDDLGDPHANGAIYQSVVEADDLSATATTSDEYITHKYGVNGAAWDATTLGNYLSGALSQTWGTNVGVAARTIRHRLELYRNTAGTPVTTRSPKLREFEYRGYKNLTPGLLGYICDIDIQASADLQRVPVETIISQIETIQSSNTLLAFILGQQATRYVRADPAPSGTFRIIEDYLNSLGTVKGVTRLFLKRIVA